MERSISVLLKWKTSEAFKSFDDRQVKGLRIAEYCVPNFRVRLYEIGYPVSVVLQRINPFKGSAKHKVPHAQES